MAGDSLHEKVCTKCGARKPRTAEYFHRAPGNNDGLTGDCKVCRNADRKRRYNENPEYERTRSRQWRKDNREHCRQVTRDWFRNNPERLRRYNKRNYAKQKAEDPDKLRRQSRIRGRLWRERNYEKAIAQERVRRSRNKAGQERATKRWRANNPGKMKEMRDRRIRREALRRAKDSGYRLTHNMRCAVRRSLQSDAPDGFFRHVPYTKQELRDHLERQFLSGMAWENYGSVWSVDNIRPVASFSYQNQMSADFQECWALSNLRPIWCEENSAKQDKPHFLI